jgi:hypothetical protein
MPAQSSVLRTYLAVALAGLLVTACPKAPTADFSLSLVEVPDLLAGDNQTYPVQPSSVPAPGQSVANTVFGLSQTRVTQTLQLRHEYARHDPFNADGSMILMPYFPDGDWRVYKTATIPYDKPEQLVRSLEFDEPRWDPADPNLVWGTRDFSILRQNVATGDTTTIKNFKNDATVGPILAAEPDLYRITTRDEGESSADKRYWAFMIQGEQDDYRPRYLLTWDRQQDTVLGLRPLAPAERNIDWVGMSTSGQWVILGGDVGNGGAIPGVTMANRALTSFHLLAYAGGHGDVGLDSHGNEVFVVQNSRTDFIDIIPFSTGVQAVQSADAYAGSGTTQLIRLYYDSGSPHGFNGGVHISCNYPGWCVVSTYTEPSAPEQNWLDRSIILVRLDAAKPRAWYLAKVHGSCNAYWEETHASIAADGSKVIWASNWGVNPGQEQVFDLQLNLPAGWPTAILAR